MKILTNTLEDLQILREKLSVNSTIGLDYETTSGHPNPNAPLQHDKVIIAGYGFAFPDGDSTYVPLKHENENAPLDEAWQLLQDTIEDPTKVIWCHNIKFEMMVSRAAEFETKATFYCTYLAGWLLNLKQFGKNGLKLKPMVQKYLDHKMISWEEVVPYSMRVHEVAPDVVAPYCADDALQCLRLADWMIPQLHEQELWRVFSELECPFAEVLVHMNEVGFKIDSKRLMELHDEFQLTEDRIAIEFRELCGVSVGSSQQVAKAMFFEKKWWPVEGVKVGKSGIPSVDKGVREKLMQRVKKGTDGYKALELKNEHARVSKLNSTYTHKLVRFADQFADKRLRCEFNQAGTDTGRLSSSKPNGQNIPSRGQGVIIRDAFICEDDWTLCVADYSGADLVMMAHLSRDKRMIDVFVNQRDLHQETADSCGVDRFTGKTCNLGLIYEMKAGTLAKNLDISEARASIIWQNWHKTYPGVNKYIERMHRFAIEHGYVRTITGRRRWLPDVHSSGYKQVLALHAASNTPDQGSVSDVIKIAMRNLLRLWKKKGVLYNVHTGEGKAKILSQVHDEIIAELREDFKEEGMDDIQRCMEDAVELRAPMRAEPGLGENWNIAKKDGDIRAKAKKQEKLGHIKKMERHLYYHPESTSYFWGGDDEADMEVVDVTGDSEHEKLAKEQGVIDV